MRDVRKTELELIAQDSNELVQLALALQKTPSVGVINLGLSPFIALVAEESFNYLTAPARQTSGNALAGPLFETFSRTVTKLRARIKLFDDKREGLEGLIKTLVLAYQKSSEWFLYPHRGFLGRLKRRLQPDLGIFYLEGYVICTTHTALLTLGLTYEQLLALSPADMGDVGSFAYEFSVAAGIYLGQLVRYLNERGYSFEATSTELAQIELPITHSDHYGHLVYTHISNRLELTRSELSTAIMFLVAQINFVERVLTHLLSPTSTLLLRARFLTAYHAMRALQVLNEMNSDSNDRTGRLTRNLLDGPDAGFLLRAREVRNVLAHYELRGSVRFLTPAGDPLNDVLVGLCQQGRTDVTAAAQRQLSRISEAFAEVFSKTTFRDSRALLGDHT